MDHNEYIESLIAKVLAGEATAAEIQEINSWRNAADENEAYFKILEQIYSSAPVAKTQRMYDADKAWQKVQKEISENKKASGVVTVPKINSSLPILRIAAAIVILAGLSFAAYKILSPEKLNPVMIVSGGETKAIKLPDSTSIFMNRDSRLIYSYSAKQRKVELTGEAFFEPSEDPARQFEVKAGGLLIQDIGTAFNVNAPEGSDSVIVFVETGEVILTSSSDKYVNLVKGEKAVYLKKRDQFIKEMIADTNAMAYKTRVFVFDNSSLISVIQKLNEIYGVKIELADNIKSCHLTATFKNENVDAILEVIAETLNLKVKRDRSSILLEGDDCEE